MNSAYQLIGVAAILISLVGTWLAAKHRAGWLLCVLSSAMWFPALVTGAQWAAVLNCVLSIAVCVRNFSVRPRDEASPSALSAAPATTDEAMTLPEPISVG
jgi:hypothetical protein